MAITVQGPTGVFQPSYPDIIDKYGVVTKMFTSSFKEYFTSSGATSYSVNKSLRFRSSASAYLNRTASAAISTYTISTWVKRGTLTSTYQYIFSHPNSANNDGYGLAYNQTTDTLYYYNGTTYATTAAYRDPAAWYHIVFVNNAGAFTLYINGSSVLTGTATTIPSGAVMNLGRWFSGISSGFYFDGEQAEINFVDGQALTPTAFGAYSTYNQWLPIAYAGTYGTNGFYLPFTNTTSTSTLVADSSGNANNWTPNNISLTAGSTYDSLTDVPTLTSTTVANYAVLNPLDSANPALATNGNLTWANPATSHLGIRGSIAIPATGAFYIEGVNVVANSANAWIGFGLAASTVSLTTNMAGTSANSFNFYSGGSASAYIYSGTSLLATLSAFSANDVVQIAVDTTNTKMWLGKNNVWYNSTGGTTGNPSTGANPTFTTSMVGLFLMIEAGGPGGAAAVNMNFGQQPFVYTAPTGFLPLNTFNI
jgi:hypothetical protein